MTRMLVLAPPKERLAQLAADDNNHWRVTRTLVRSLLLYCSCTTVLLLLETIHGYRLLPLLLMRDEADRYAAQ